MNNKIYLPSIRSKVDSFYVMSLLEKASELEKKGKEIFHFELGEPIESTPGPIKKKINNLISSNVSGYTASNGIFKLRENISNFYEKNYKVKINPEQIFITTGSSGAFLLSFMSIFDPGKKVGIFNPVYPAYRNILKSLNIEIKALKLDRIGRVVNNVNRTVKIESKLPLSNGLIPNLMAELSINHYSKDSAVCLPSRLVLKDSKGKTFVKILDKNNSVVICPVKLGKNEKTIVEIISKLEVGSLVIDDGKSTVLEGQEVEIIRGSSL